MLRLFHRYFGLVFAWIAFFIFFSGTLAYYRDDITLFMQPEYYEVNYKNSEYIDTAVEYFKKHHPNSDIWRITPPGDLTPYISLSWQDNAKVKEHRRNRKSVKIDPNTSELLKGRTTYGGAFLSALHYDLWFVKRIAAREIMGYITVVMLFILISGIFIHGRILKDFFKFKKKSAWLDLHILSSVSGFVIFFMLAVSGLYLVERFMLKDIYLQVAEENKANLQENFNAKAKARNEERKKQRALAKLSAEQNLTSVSTQILTNNLDKNVSETVAKTHKFIPSIEQIKNIIGKNNNKNIETIIIQRNFKDTAYVQLNFTSEKPFTDSGVGLSAKIFDLSTGDQVEEIAERKLDRASFVAVFMKLFHIGEFGGSIVKFIFFIFGCAGLIMCASGVFLWSKKRHSNFAKNVIKTLNNTFFIGLFTALGSYFLANQLISYEVKLRYEYEVYAFFTAFAIAFLFGILFVKRYAYAITSTITSLVFIVVSVVSIGNGSFANFAVFKISITCALVSVIFIYLSFKFAKEKA